MRRVHSFAGRDALTEMIYIHNFGYIIYQKDTDTNFLPYLSYHLNISILLPVGASENLYKSRGGLKGGSGI